MLADSVPDFAVKSFSWLQLKVSAQGDARASGSAPGAARHLELCSDSGKGGQKEDR